MSSKSMDMLTKKYKSQLSKLTKIYGLGGSIILDRAIALSLKEKQTIDLSIGAITAILPPINVFDPSTLRIMAYSPLIISGWNPERTRRVMVINDGCIVQQYINAASVEEISKQNAFYVRYLMNRAKNLLGGSEDDNGDRS